MAPARVTQCLIEEREQPDLQRALTARQEACCEAQHRRLWRISEEEGAPPEDAIREEWRCVSFGKVLNPTVLLFLQMSLFFRVTVKIK